MLKSTSKAKIIQYNWKLFMTFATDEIDFEAPAGIFRP